MPNITMRLVDDDGKDVEEGKPGEAWIKGPVVTNGYYRNPQATKDSIVDGWFCTGDIAIWKNGMPYIVDRKKVFVLPLPWNPADRIGTYQIQRHAGGTGRARRSLTHPSEDPGCSCNRRGNTWN